MSDNKSPCGLGNIYKIIDYTRGHQKEIKACTLKQLINISRIQFNFPKETNIKVVLDIDGTEIEDEEYFATLEKNTNLMILNGNQKWVSFESKTSTFFVIDDTDCINNFSKKRVETCNYVQIKSIVSSIYKDPSHLYLLSGNDLEILSNMNSIKITDIIYDRLLIDQLKEAANKFLAEKRQVQESINLLQIFSSKNNIK